MTYDLQAAITKFDQLAYGKWESMCEIARLSVMAQVFEAGIAQETQKVSEAGWYVVLVGPAYMDNKIPLIKSVRQWFGISLLDAKRWVEGIKCLEGQVSGILSRHKDYDKAVIALAEWNVINCNNVATGIIQGSDSYTFNKYNV